MQDHPEILDGPDFLEHVADAEAANGNHIHAAEYRRRARQWRDDQLALSRSSDSVADLQRRIDAIGQQIAA